MRTLGGTTTMPRQRRRQPAALCYSSYYLTFLLATGVMAATIGDSDPSVQYTPATPKNDLCSTFNPCLGQWFSENIAGAYLNSVKTTAGPTTSLSLTFVGTSIAVRGVLNERGAQALVTVDGGAASLAKFDSPDGQQHLDAIVFQQNDLAPGVNHTLVLQYDPSSSGRRRPRFIRIDAFEVETVIKSTDASPSPSSSSNHGSVIQTPSHPTTPDMSTASPPPPPSSANTDQSTPPTSTDSTSSPSTDTPVIIGTSTSSNGSSMVPVYAGIGTGIATLLIASSVVFILLRRRRAIRVKSMDLPRSAPQSPPRSQNMSGLANLAYAFNKRGASVASSDDVVRRGLPRPTAKPSPETPPTNANYVSPYNYQRPGPAYPRSADSSSLGPPVDERRPNDVGSPVSLAGPSWRVLRVHNPDGSTVVSSNG